MNVLDYVFIGILIVFTVRGVVRGMINEVFGVGSFLISLLLALVFYENMGKIFAASMNPVAANILGFLTVFICVFVLIKMMQMLTKTVFSGTVLNSLDKALGLILGFVEGGAVIYLILIVMEKANGLVDTSALRDQSAVNLFMKCILA